MDVRDLETVTHFDKRQTKKSMRLNCPTIYSIHQNEQMFERHEHHPTRYESLRFLTFTTSFTLER